MAYEGKPPCRTTLECRYWSAVQGAWARDGLSIHSVNGTEGVGGCAATHLTDFVVVTVPTDVVGDIQLGLVDVGSLAARSVRTVRLARRTVCRPAAWPAPSSALRCAFQALLPF